MGKRKILKNYQRHIVKDIDPKVSILDREGELLLDLASSCKKGNIVEIGSWLGRSTIWLAAGFSQSKASQEKDRWVIAIDPHQGIKEYRDTYSEFQNNLKRANLVDYVLSVKEKSEDFLPSMVLDVEGAFIDGLHDYEPVLRDFQMLEDRIPLGGWLAFHDTTGYKGPRKVVFDEIFHSLEWKVVGVIGQVVAARKTQPSVLTWLNNAFVFYYKLIYDLGFILASKLLPQSIKERIK